MSTTAPAAPAPTPAVRDTDELFAALRSLFACTRRMRSWVTDAGPMTVLGVVDAHEEARVGTLAAALHVDVSTVSRSLAALGRDGLVQWRPDERDARSHLVSCTDEGRARLLERRAQIADDLTARLSGWPDDRRRRAEPPAEPLRLRRPRRARRHRSPDLRPQTSALNSNPKESA